MGIDPTSPPADAGDLRPPRISVARYDRMVAAGAIPDLRHVELRDGRIVRKPTPSQARHVARDMANSAPKRADPAGCFVAFNAPVVLGPWDEHDADLLVVRGLPDDYRDRHPKAGRSSWWSRRWTPRRRRAWPAGWSPAWRPGSRAAGYST